MQKTILITGSTDGIGLEAAKALHAMGHHVLLHGRNLQKLDAAKETFDAVSVGGSVESYLADLSRMSDVMALSRSVAAKHDRLDILINNAGVFRSSESLSSDGLDLRFAVNTYAPYLLTEQLLPLLERNARVVNVSSAAQSSVDLDALAGRTRIPDQLKAYAQSKLALTMWSRAMADSHTDDGLVCFAVNPGSLLATKMVKEGFGVAGKDMGIGTDILVRAAVSDEFAEASGRYFDNDKGEFGPPHPDALDPHKCSRIVEEIEAVLGAIG